MYLLILQSEYQSQSSFPSVTANHTNHTIDGDDYIHCEITDANGYASIKPNLDTDLFVENDGVILPEEVRK